VAHSTPTDQKPSIAPIFVHSSTGIWHLKEKPVRAGGVFLSRGKWEILAMARGEATARREVAAGTLRGVGGATRGDATTSRGKRDGSATRSNAATGQCVKRWWRIKRLQHDKKPHNNQPNEWEASAHQEVLTAQPL
jgi:hypothetical protein